MIDTTIYYIIRLSTRNITAGTAESTRYRKPYTCEPIAWSEDNSQEDSFGAGRFLEKTAAKWAQMLQKVKEICAQIVSAVSDMNSQVQSMCATMIAAINAVKAAASSLGSVGGGGFSGTGGGGARAAAFSAAPMMADIPKLATGAVLRGGNPFMAILNDQPVGQTNIEAPLKTIEQAVENVMSRQGYNNNAPVPAQLILQLNGTNLGEAFIDDLLSVMNRRGLDVEVLGVT